MVSGIQSFTQKTTNLLKWMYRIKNKVKPMKLMRTPLTNHLFVLTGNYLLKQREGLLYAMAHGMRAFALLLLN